MRFWQAITWVETEQLPALAQFAEELGFYGLMGGDHAVYPEEIAGGYPYSDNGLPPMRSDDEYPDQWVSMAAMATVTQRLKFTTGVYVLPVRNPHEVARATATLAILSQQRLVLGVGVGWMREEFDIYGVDFTRRGRRMDEMIEVLQGLWTGEPFAYQGQEIQFPAVRLSPVPKEAPPIYVGGASAVALRRAARVGDGWIGAGNTLDEVPEVLRQLQQYREEAGRADRPFDTLIGLTTPLDRQACDSLQAMGSSSVVVPPFRFTLGVRSSLDDKKRWLEQFANQVLRHYSV